MKIKTLIIDDDINWQKNISKFVETNPALALVGTCSSAMDGYAIMIETKIDLLICNVEMPDMSGITFIKNIRNAPLVIFISAHRNQCDYQK
jgi:two-component SAPR family response regulator